MLGASALPTVFVSEDLPAIKGFSSWLVILPLLTARILYVSVVSTGTEGSTAAFHVTECFLVRRPFHVARVIALQPA